MSPTTPTLIDSGQLRGLFPGMGRSSFYKLIWTAGFPTPVQPVPGGDYFWYDREVHAYLEGCRVRPGQSRRPAPVRTVDQGTRPRAIGEAKSETGDGLVVRRTRKVAA